MNFTGIPVTFLIFHDFYGRLSAIDYTLMSIFLWIALWTGWCALMMKSVPGNEAADNEIIAFRASIAVVFLFFVVRIFFDLSRWIIVIPGLVVAYTAMMTTLRVRRVTRSVRRANRFKNTSN